MWSRSRFRSFILSLINTNTLKAKHAPPQQLCFCFFLLTAARRAAGDSARAVQRHRRVLISSWPLGKTNTGQRRRDGGSRDAMYEQMLTLRHAASWGRAKENVRAGSRAVVWQLPHSRAQSFPSITCPPGEPHGRHAGWTSFIPSASVLIRLRPVRCQACGRGRAGRPCRLSR